MPRKKLTPQQAKAMLIADGVDFSQDFHSQDRYVVGRLEDLAKAAGYRKSKSAPGSTVRMFYQYLSRVEPVVRAAGQLTQAERRAYQARARNKKKTSAQLETRPRGSSTRHATVKKSVAQLDREIAEAIARPTNGVKIGDAVQFRWEPGTGGVIRRFESDAAGRSWAWVATPRGERKVPADALVRVRKEHELRVRRAVGMEP